MGCFNSVCMLSGLPIQYHDPIVIVFLVESNYKSCGPCGNWRLVGIPIEGEYNDYGGIEYVVDDDNCKLMTKYLIENMAAGKNSKEDNSYHCFKTPTDMESIVKICEYSKLTHIWLNKTKTDIGELRYAMILKSVWDKTITYLQNMKTWSGKPLGEVFNENIQEFWDYEIKNYIDHLYSSDSLYRSICLYSSDYTNYFISEYVLDYGASIDEINNVIDMLMPLGYINNFMYNMFKQWRPAVYGGQSDWSDDLVRYNTEVIAEIVKQKIEQDEENV